MDIIEIRENTVPSAALCVHIVHEVLGPQGIEPPPTVDCAIWYPGFWVEAEFFGMRTPQEQALLCRFYAITVMPLVCSMSLEEADRLLEQDLRRFQPFAEHYRPEGGVPLELVCQMSGYSRATVWRLVASGQLPRVDRRRPVRLKARPVIRWYFGNRQLPRAPHDRECEVFWRLLLADRQRLPVLPPWGSALRVRELAKLLPPAGVETPAALRELLRPLCAAEIRLLSGLYLGMANAWRRPKPEREARLRSRLMTWAEAVLRTTGSKAATLADVLPDAAVMSDTILPLQPHCLHCGSGALTLVPAPTEETTHDLEAVDQSQGPAIAAGYAANGGIAEFTSEKCWVGICGQCHQTSHWSFSQLRDTFEEFRDKCVAHNKVLPEHERLPTAEIDEACELTWSVFYHRGGTDHAVRWEDVAAGLDSSVVAVQRAFRKCSRHHGESWRTKFLLGLFFADDAAMSLSACADIRSRFVFPSYIREVFERALRRCGNPDEVRLYLPISNARFARLWQFLDENAQRDRRYRAKERRLAWLVVLVRARRRRRARSRGLWGFLVRLLLWAAPPRREGEAETATEPQVHPLS